MTEIYTITFMKKIILSLILVLCLASIGEAQTGESYKEDFIPAKYIADKSKPTLVMFTATWCGPCHAMKSSTMKNNAVQAVLNSMNVLFIDIDSKGSDIYEKKFTEAGYEHAVPFFAILDTSGKVVKHTTGYMKAEKFLVFLDMNVK